MSQSMFWSEELLASLSPLRACGADWPIPAATWRSSFLAWLSANGLAGSFGKMSLEYVRPMTDGLLVPSSGAWANSGTGGPTEAWTLSSSTWHSDASVCSLSDILEDAGNVPPKYYLSPRACAGILRRAEKRGKDLPHALRQALQAVAEGSSGLEKAEGKIR